MMWYAAGAFFVNAGEYLRTLSPARIVNLTALLFSYYLSLIIRKPVVWGLPFALSTEPSGHCQLKCPECPTGAGTLNRIKGTMPLSLFNRVLHQTRPQLMYLNLFFQGEPLLNKELPLMALVARSQRIYTTISTNGLLLTHEMCSSLVMAGVSRVVVSLDGMSQAVYEKYRKGGRVEEVKAGIRRLLAARKSMRIRLPLVVVQFLMFEHNQHELPAVKEWCRNNGVDKLEIKRAQINGLTNNTIEPPADPRWSRYKKTRQGDRVMRKKARNHCRRLWSSAVVAWNGNVAPCCYDKDLEQSPGNTEVTDLKLLFRSKRMKRLRKQVLKDRSVIDMCNNCPEGRGSRL